MPSTYFATGWRGGPFLPVPKVGLDLVTLRLPTLCSTDWAIGVVSFYKNLSAHLSDLTLHLVQI